MLWQKVWKEIEITKDNYEGYLELYELYIGIKLSEQYQKVDFSHTCIYTIDSLTELLEKKKNQKIELLFSDELKEIFYETLKKNNEQLKLTFLKFKMLEMRYPYIDCNLNCFEIEQGLLKVKLLQKNENYEYRLNYRNFCNYLELKEKIETIPLINEKKHQIIPCNNKVPYVKIKHKTRGE